MHMGDDPNFPPNLAIRPSESDKRRALKARLHFDQKSGIETYGIAGRVWQVS